MEFGSSVSVRKIRAKINLLPTNKIFVKNMVGLKVLIATYVKKVIIGLFQSLKN